MKIHILLIAVLISLCCYCYCQEFRGEGILQLQAYPLYSSTSENAEIELKFKKLSNTSEAKYRIKKSSDATWGAWKNIDMTATTAGFFHSFTIPKLENVHSYDIEVSSTFGANTHSAIVTTRIKKEWPVKDVNGKEIFELVHNFNQPHYKGPMYLHGGLDLNGNAAIEGENVYNPLGGLWVSSDGSNNNYSYNNAIYIDGNWRLIQINHLHEKFPGFSNPYYTMGSNYLAGKITEKHFPDTKARHINFTYSSSTGEIIDAVLKNPFDIYKSEAIDFLDPQKKKPKISSTSTLIRDIIALRTQPTGTESPKTVSKYKVEGAVDIYAQAYDEQSSDGPWQAPGKVGYYILRAEKGAWKPSVKSADKPYILMSNQQNYGNVYQPTNSETSKTEIMVSDLKADAEKEQTWDHYFQWIVTNTNSEIGAKNGLDRNQCWATDAKKQTTNPSNGYKLGYEKAKNNEEALFPDGNYKICIVAEDMISSHKVDYCEKVTLSNFIHTLRSLTFYNQMRICQA